MSLISGLELPSQPVHTVPMPHPRKPVLFLSYPVSVHPEGLAPESRVCTNRHDPMAQQQKCYQLWVTETHGGTQAGLLKVSYLLWEESVFASPALRPATCCTGASPLVDSCPPGCEGTTGPAVSTACSLMPGALLSGPCGGPVCTALRSRLHCPVRHLENKKASSARLLSTVTG